MTSRNPRTGGRIAPRGRTPQAPGVGRTAKRHDLERPATPGLSNSDLQQGDVGELEQGQALAPRAGAKRVQPEASGGTRSGSPSSTQSQTGLEVPDPLDFAEQRLGGSFTGRPGAPMPRIDPSPWIPLLQKLVTSPNAGGALTQTYIAQIGNMVRRAQAPNQIEVNLNDLDTAFGSTLE